MANDLQNKLNQIKLDKDTNLLPENLKAGITCLGVNGTYKGSGGTAEGAKIFGTVDEMQADTTSKEGDIAVVVKTNIHKTFAEYPMMSNVWCPEAIVLDEPIDITNSRSLQYYSGDYDYNMQFYLSGSNKTPAIQLSYSNMSTMSGMSVRYTSSDGLTWTRAYVAPEAVNDILTFPYEIDWSTVEGYDTFDLTNVFSQNMNNFDGIYEARNIDDTSRVFYLDVVDNKYVSDEQKTVLRSNIISALEVAVRHLDGDSASYKSASICYNPDTNDYMFLILKDTSYHVANGSYIATYNNDVYICSEYRYQNGDWTNTKYQVYSIIVDGDTNTVQSSNRISSYDLQYTDTSNYSYRFMKIPDGYYYIDGYSHIYLYADNPSTLDLSRDATLYGFTSTTEGKYVTSLNLPTPQKPKYFGIKTQFTLKNPAQLDSGLVVLGADGSVTGTLRNKDNLTKNDIKYKVELWSDLSNGLVCPEDIGSLFSGCTDLTEIPILDTSNTTNMNFTFSNCRNLTNIPLLDMSKVTSVQGIFNSCTSLTEIPLFNTSECKYFNNMCNGCTNLVTIPTLNSKNVVHAENMVANCTSLSDESLNNILSICINATSYTSTKTLKFLGLTSEQATKCATLGNYQAFLNAGWTTGY